ncbi:MAG: hypothetical protein H0T75_16340 [Rhizobiales bacterium]|jgi:hypothetical protein|nr:hypothetical protein [Hyphomicrobiales bacterium]MDQ3558061.1 hypothetical protein [Pseudomonadota bacterium]
MAKILAFTRLDTARSRKAGERSAEIVIFPGVRVEYHDCPPSPAGNGRPRGRGGRGPSKGALSA